MLASEISQEPQDLLESGEDDAPIIKLVNSLLHNAVKERASDLHLEPFENELRVRFRIDNVLYEPIKPLPKALQASIVSRIKIMGRLNIAEKRLPRTAGSGSRSPAATTTCGSRRCRSPTASAS
jgi:general secretion pathway protein E